MLRPSTIDLRTAVAAIALGCASAPPVVRSHPAMVPAAVAPMEFAASAIDRGIPTLMQRIGEGGREGYRQLRLTHAEMEGWVAPDALARHRTILAGLFPSPADRRWFAWQRWQGSSLTGWCARGVRVASRGGTDGFVEPTLVVDRLLVLGSRDGATWAAWLEGLVLTSTGWRFAPWVPHAQSLEAPRRGHPDVHLWDCDLARQPATSTRPPGG